MASGSPYRTEAESIEPEVPDYAARRRASVGLKWLLVGFACRAVMGLAFGGLIAVSTATGHVHYGAAAAWGYAFVDAGLIGATLFGSWSYAGLPTDGLSRSGLVLGMVLLVAVAALGFVSATWVDEQGLLAAKTITHTLTPADEELAEQLQTRVQVIGTIVNLAGLVWAATIAASLRRTAAWLEDPRFEQLAVRVLTLTIAVPLSGLAVVAATTALATSVLGLVVAAVGALALLTAAIVLFIFWLQLLGGLSKSLADASIPPMAEVPLPSEAEAWDF